MEGLVVLVTFDSVLAGDDQCEVSGRSMTQWSRWIQPLLWVVQVSVLTATVTGGEACGYLLTEGEGFKCWWLWRQLFF